MQERSIKESILSIPLSDKDSPALALLKTAQIGDHADEIIECLQKAWVDTVDWGCLNGEQQSFLGSLHQKYYSENYVKDNQNPLYAQVKP